MRPMQYHDTHVFLICFSCVDKASLDSVKTKWVPEIKANVQDPLYMLVSFCLPGLFCYCRSGFRLEQRWICKKLSQRKPYQPKRSTK